jgi:hypothetical protein
MSFTPYPEWGRGADEADMAAGLKAFRTPLGEYLGAQVREGFWATLPGQALAQRERLTADAPNESPLTAEEWRASPHFRPSIPFDEKFTPARAKAVAEVFDENAYRRWLIDQRDAGALDGTLGFIAGIGGSIPDPVNFIPWVGPAFRAARVARYGVVGGRAISGAVEGAIGTAVAQPFLVPSRNQFGDDVGFADVTLDIALGAFAGAAIGGASGVWSKFTAARVETRARKAADAADADLAVAPRDTVADPIPDVQRQNTALYALDRAAQDVAAGRPVDIDPRVASEMAGVRQAYDAVRSEPMGLKDDPLVSITPEQIDATAIARGGWKGLGDAEVPGSGSGLVKIIWRHGEESRKPVAERVTREDVMALPNVVRELQAKSGAKEANRMWVRQRDDGEHVVYIDGPTDGGRRVLSIFVAKDKAEYPLSPNLGEGGSPGRVRSPAGDTAREPLARLPESRDGNMPPKGRAVNFAKAAPEPAALPEPERVAPSAPATPAEAAPARDADVAAWQAASPEAKTELARTVIAEARKYETFKATEGAADQTLLAAASDARIASVRAAAEKLGLQFDESAVLTDALASPEWSRIPNLKSPAKRIEAAVAMFEKTFAAADPQAPNVGKPGRSASPERTATIDDTTGLLDDAEALVATGRLSAEDAATLKAARQALADTAAFDDGAAAAASCFRR